MSLPSAALSRKDSGLPLAELAQGDSGLHVLPMQGKETLLTSAEFFGAMSSETKEACLKSIRMVSFAPNTIIIEEDTIGSSLYFVDAGKVAATRHGELVGVLGGNEFFGEMAFMGLVKSFVDAGLVDGGTVLPDLASDEFAVSRLRTVTAIEEVRLLELGVKDFLSVFKEDLPGLRAVIKVLRASGLRRQQEITRLEQAHARELPPAFANRQNTDDLSPGSPTSRETSDSNLSTGNSTHMGGLIDVRDLRAGLSGMKTSRSFSDMTTLFSIPDVKTHTHSGSAANGGNTGASSSTSNSSRGDISREDASRGDTGPSKRHESGASSPIPADDKYGKSYV